MNGLEAIEKLEYYDERIVGIEKIISKLVFDKDVGYEKRMLQDMKENYEKDRDALKDRLRGIKL